MTTLKSKKMYYEVKIETLNEYFESEFGLSFSFKKLSEVNKFIKICLNNDYTVQVCTIENDQ